jgi:hypothetical protein
MGRDSEMAANLPGVNVLLIGPAGTGKTYSVATLVESGVEVFYLGLEAGLESLLGYWTDAGKPIPDNLRWHFLEPATAGFLELQDAALKVNTMSLKALADMQDLNRSKYNQLVKLYTVLNDFEDQRGGQKYGPIDKWDTTRCLVIDSLTGINKAALDAVVGGKPVRSQSDWGIAQNQVENLLRKLCDGCKCHFVLLAHVEREVDQILGGVKLMVSTLGKALAPKIPPMFSDVILTKREGLKFSWSTADSTADTKTRNLPLAEGITPSFAPIITKWRARAGLVM